MKITIQTSDTAAPDLSKCGRALFLQSVSIRTAALLYVFLMIFSVVLTTWLRSLAINDISSPTPISAPEAPISSPEGQEAPPPYEPATATGTADATPVPSTLRATKKKGSRASNFVIGTFVFILLVFTQLCIPLTIQNLHYCHDLPKFVAMAIILSLNYGVVALWASVGAACWTMLLRNLWGKKAEQKWLINQYAVPLCLLMAVVGPFMLVGYGLKLVLETLAGPLARMVEGMQRRVCGDEVLEENEEGLRLEDGLRPVVEERQGLLTMDAMGSEEAERRVSVDESWK